MNNYSKKRSVVSLVLFALILALVTYTVIAGFGYDHVGSMSAVSLGLDLRGGVSITYEAVEEEPNANALADTVNKIRNRVAEYSNEARVNQEGTNRITIEIPGLDDPEAVLRDLGRPGTLVFCKDAEHPDAEDSKVMDGNDVVSADRILDNGEYKVQLMITEDAQARFAAATKELAGTNKPLYIVYDGEVISSPVVKEEINSPTCVVEGNFTADSAEQLASFIRIGALPVSLKELRSEVVGATLGSKAIETSLIAGLIGLALVCVLMIVLFRVPGFAASLALVFYSVFIVLILSLFNNELTLTLPGIAGIILSIGMAVDANVIISSRIQEEIGLGNTVSNAINAGFKKALSAVIDGNVTTLIAAVILMIFGSTAVQGFAVTLAIGIVLSMFTSLVVARLLIKSFYGLGIQNEKFYGKKKPAKAKNFLGKKGIFFAISGVVIAIGVVFMVIHGTKTYPLNFSLDFVGGTSAELSFPESRRVEQLESEVKPVIAGVIGTEDIVLTPVRNEDGTAGQKVILKTPSLDSELRAQMYEKLETEFQATKDREENISGVISAEMARSAIIAVVIATVAMLIYIWIRFRDLRFGASSVLALVHDVLVVLAGYAIFRWSVGNTFIACMLTLVGYSINATIVVFDRIRENLAERGENADLKEIVNLSISQTLGRSIYTSLTTLIMVTALYIFGVTSIREFALPLMVGIVVGGYSSVCLAGAFWYLFRTKIGKKKAVAKAKK